jgi:hypothetical protein
MEAEVVAAMGRTPQAHHYNEKATISLLFFVGRFRFEKVVFCKFVMIASAKWGVKLR